MKKNLAKLGATLVSIALPIATFAQQPTGIAAADCANGGGLGITHVICVVYGLIKIIIPVLILGAVAYFIWGIVQFIGTNDAEERTAARGTMIHGIIGFAVILGLWGLVNILLRTLSVSNDVGPGTLPTF